MPAVSTVAVLESDARLRWVLRTALEQAGHRVWVGDTGAAAVAAFEVDDDRLGLLVVGATEGGRAVARQVRDALRDRGRSIPAALLLAEPEVPLDDFLEPGDGVLVKPFTVSALCEHVGTLLRDAPNFDGAGGVGDEDDRAFDGMRFDDAAMAVLVGEDRIDLTRAEYRVLAALAARPGELVESAVLIEAGWPDGSVVYEETLAKHVDRLRRKLDDADAPVALLSVAGFGYELV